MAGQAARRDARGLPRPDGGHRLPDGEALARGRRQGRRPLPGLLPRGDRARRRACCRFKVRGAPVEPTQADSHFGSYLCSILKTSLELALDRRASSSTCSSPTRSATRRATWPASGAATSPIPCRDPLPAAERELGARRRLPARRVRPPAPPHRGRSPAAPSPTTTCAARSPSSTRTARLLRGSTRSSARRRGWLGADEAYVLIAVGGHDPARGAQRAAARRAAAARGAAPRGRRTRSASCFEGGFCEQPPLDLLARHRPLVLRRRRRPPDRPALDHRRRAARRRSAGTRWPRRTSSARRYSPVQHDLRKPKEQMLLERIRDVRRAGRDRHRRQDVRARARGAGGLHARARRRAASRTS